MLDFNLVASKSELRFQLITSNKILITFTYTFRFIFQYNLRFVFNNFFEFV